MVRVEARAFPRQRGAVTYHRRAILAPCPSRFARIVLSRAGVLGTARLRSLSRRCGLGYLPSPYDPNAETLARWMKTALAAVMASVAAVFPSRADTVTDLLRQYEAQGPARFSAATAETQWTKQFRAPKTGEMRHSSTCHSEDLRKTR